MAKIFSKELWLQSARAQKAEGTLTQREIDDALEIWVNDFDGKTQEELEQNGESVIRDDWFAETSG